MRKLRPLGIEPRELTFNGGPGTFSTEVAMPLYEYELCEGDCAVCGGKFTLRRPVKAAPLTQCPACRKPVRKIISTFNSPVKLKPTSVTDAKKAGFTVLKRIAKGEYERQ
jgi:putative FmdB family regulatory protein